MSDLRHVYEGSGLTRVCVDGQHVITGGSDGVVALFLTKRWPTSSALWARKCHGDSAVTCAVLDDKLSLAITAGRDGRVVLHERIHDAPESVSSRDLCRLKGEVRCLLYDAPRKRIFVGGNAFHCLHMRENKYEISTYPLPSEFAASPITAASVSPCGQLIALANTAGQITLLSSTIPSTSSETLPSEEESAGPYAKVRTRIVERTFTSRSKTDDNTAYNLSLVQSVSGLFLFVPTSTNVSVYKVELKDGTTPHLRLATSLTTGTDGYHGAVAYSTSVKDMACVVGTIHRTVSFKLSDGKRGLTSSIHRQREHQSEETTATALSVCVATGDVAVGLNNGSILLLPKFSKTPSAPKKKATEETAPVPEKSEKVENEEEGDEAESDGERSDSDRSSSSSEYDSDTFEVKDDLGPVVDDLLKHNNCLGVEGKRPSAWRKKDKSQAELDAFKRMNFIEDEAMDASSEESEEPAEMDYLDDYEAPTKRNNTIEDYDNEEDEEGEDQDGENNGNGENATTVVAARPADYSFQIGATPVGEEGSCYLAYNSTGYIHCSRDGTVVHFHDISHPAVPIMRKGILMGALSPVGAGFILSPLDTEDPLISDGLPRLSVYYRTFTALGAQSEWQAYLQPEETVRCMTTGLRYLAVATNRYLRLYSLSGVELAVLSKFPRIVTMVGTSSEKLMRSYRADFDPLAVCYMDGTELRVEVLDVLSRSSVVPSHTLPLTEVEDGGSHQLQWMGWSEDGPLHTVDTAGVVRMFTQSWGGTWVPVFDPRTSHDQSYNYWIWGVNDEVLLAFRSSRGDSPYPAAIASGLPSEHVRLYMPLTRTANEREMVTWDHVLRREIRTDEIKRHSQFYTESIARHDALHDKKILELFNAALKEQQTTRALDLATMLELRDNVEVCTKAANSAGQERLVHKLLALYEMRVKSKSKRKCPLPLEGTVASEKERDLLLRKLLKEKANGGAPSPSAAENPSITVEPKQQNETSLITGNSEPVARQQHVTFQQPIEKVVKSAPAVVAPKATKPLGHAMSSSTTRKEEAKVEQPVKKPSNPFSKATPAKTTTDIGLIGESQPAVAPAMNHNTTARQDTPTKPVDATADPASPSPTSRPSAASNAGPVTGGFTPKVLPVKAPTPTATARSVSADPFLAEEGETMDETETTIQGILDVGHEESNYAPRTASFGEALRKRYREESDSDTEDLPIPVLPRVE